MFVKLELFDKWTCSPGAMGAVEWRGEIGDDGVDGVFEILAKSAAELGSADASGRDFIASIFSILSILSVFFGE